MPQDDDCFCPVCEKPAPAVFRPGPAGRPDASCPHCGSLERHRFLAVLLACLRPTLADLGVLLDVAPSPQVTPLLARLGPRTHLRLDLGADNRLVDVLGSLTDLPLPDRSVDLIVCYHVLEHVPDDLRAMREISRVLAPGGVALLQVPWRPHLPTDEDPEAPTHERVRRFGQADHVRYYGHDFEDRLLASGLSFTRVTPRTMIGDAASAWMKLMPGETSWLAVADDAPAKAGPGTNTSDTLARVFDALLTQRATARDGCADARARPPAVLPIREATRQFGRAAKASGRRKVRQTRRLFSRTDGGRASTR